MHLKSAAMLTALAICLTSGKALAVVLPPPMRDLDACLAAPRSGATGCYQEATEVMLRFTEECFDKLIAPQSKMACLATAENYWDERMNYAYGLLMARLNAGAKTGLRNAQRQWLVYRDETASAFEAPFWGNEMAYKKVETRRIVMEIVQHRARMLEGMLVAITADR